jgi:peptide/nickel transport system substrate-binding protein
MGNPATSFQKRSGLLLVLILCLLLGLVACSDGNNSTVTTATSPGTQAQNPENAPAPVVGNITVPPGSNGFPYDCAKIFCFGLAQEPVGLLNSRFDPANLVDRPSLQISRQVYENLFEYKSPGMQYSYSALLKYAPVESDDGLSYTLRVGKGLQFSDTTPLNAEAIKFNFDRWSDPGNLYHKGDFQTYATYFGGFPGNLASVEANAADNTVRIRLKQPMGSLYQVLAMPQFAIVSPSAFNKVTGEFERNIGSGFYTIDKMEREPNKYVALRENRNYFVQRYAPNDPATPYVKSPTIVARVLKQNQDGLEELRRGTIGATDKIRPEQVSRAAQSPDLQLLDRKPLNLAFLGMDVTRPPFNNTSVRQAFAQAINLQDLIKEAYFDLGTPASVFLPPATLGQIDLHNPYAYDPDRARRLLDNAGYNATNPLRLDLWVLPVPRAYYPDPRKVADAIASDLSTVGVTVTVRDSKSWPDFNRDRQTGNLGFYMFGWQGQNGDPDEFLGEFFGKQRGEGGYENPILRGLIQQGLTQADLRNRREPYKEAQDIIYDQLPVIPLAYVKGVVALRSNVTGYAPSPNGIESWTAVQLMP